MTTSKKMLQGAALERERLAVMVNNYKIVCIKSGSDKKLIDATLKKQPSINYAMIMRFQAVTQEGHISL